MTILDDMNRLALAMDRLMRPPTAAEVLARLELAQRRIATRQYWCTGYAAVNKDDMMTAATSPTAVRRCAIGAVYADSPASISEVAYNEEPVVRHAIAALNRAAETLLACQPDIIPTTVHQSADPIVKINDAPEYGHTMVIRAYEAAKAEQRILAIAG